METTGTTDYYEEPSGMPADLDALRAMVKGRDDDTMYEGIRAEGVDTVVTHVGLTLLPGAVAPAGGDAQGVIQLVIGTSDEERRLWISRRGTTVSTGVGSADHADATVAMKLTDLLRLVSNEPGRDVAAQLATKSMRVTGDEALVRAFPAWFLLPG